MILRLDAMMPIVLDISVILGLLPFGMEISETIKDQEFSSRLKMHLASSNKNTYNYGTFYKTYASVDVVKLLQAHNLHK